MYISTAETKPSSLKVSVWCNFWITAACSRKVKYAHCWILSYPGQLGTGQTRKQACARSKLLFFTSTPWWLEVTLQAHQSDGLRLDIDCQYTSYSTHLYVQNVHILMLLLLFSYINSGNSALVQPLISRLLALMLPQPGNHWELKENAPLIASWKRQCSG